MSDPTSNGDATDVAELGYEDARDELLEVVRALEGGGVTLEESLALWERGEALARRCQEWLDGARARLDAARGDVQDAPAADTDTDTSTDTDTDTDTDMA